MDAGFAGDQRLIDGLFSSAGRIDPHAVLRGSGQAGCRYAIARDVLHSPNFIGPVVSSDAEMFRMFRRWMLTLDGERHRTMRRAFGGCFTPRRTPAYRARIERRAGALLDAVADCGAMDLVADFARPLPLAVICEVLGVPDADVPWIDAQMTTLNLGFAHQRELDYLEAAGVAAVEMQHYFGELLDARRSGPREDLISALARDLPGDPETRADVLANCVLFINAGHVTTTSLVAAGTLALLRHPDQLARLRAEPALIGGAVEELLRLVTPTSSVMTRAVADDEVGGCPFAAGEHRFMFLLAANRDPEVFADPDRLDVTRDPNPHLSFSAGRHYCLGAPLARLHGEVAITALLARLPRLRLDGEPQWRSAMPLRELEALPVAWDPARLRHREADAVVAGGAE